MATSHVAPRRGRLYRPLPLGGPPRVGARSVPCGASRPRSRPVSAFRTLVLVAVLGTPAAAPAGAQAASPPTVHDLAYDPPASALWSGVRRQAGEAARRRHDALVVGGLATAVALLGTTDARVEAFWEAPARQRSVGMQRAAAVANTVGSPGVLVAGVGAYALGRVTRTPQVADVGLHGTEAIVASSAITGLLKGVVGRARPNVADGDPSRFRPVRGFRSGGYTAFPSGHTTAAFAAAAVLTDEMARVSARRRWIVGPVAYAAAAATGAARMYDDKHWLSDVAAGAVIGTLSGRYLVRAAHAGRRSALDRWLLGVRGAPGTDGAVRVEWRTAW